MPRNNNNRHQDGNDNEDNNNNDDGAVTCPSCPRAFQTNRGMIQHLNSAQHGFQCGQCTQRFISQHAARNHERNQHNGNQQQQQQQQQQQYADSSSFNNNNNDNGNNHVPLAIPKPTSTRQRGGNNNNNNNNNNDRPCFNCGKTGHFARDCHQKMEQNTTYTRPQRDGNNNNNNNNRRNNNNSNSNNNDRPCFNCGKTGHFARDCPQNENQNRYPVNNAFSNREAKPTSWGNHQQQQQQQQQKDNKGNNSYAAAAASPAGDSSSSSAVLTLQQQLLQGSGGDGLGMNNGVNRQSKNFYDKIVHQFTTSKEAEITFPPTLTPAQRQQVHRLAANYGLQHKSHGEGANRAIRLSKASASKEFYTNVQPLNDRNLASDEQIKRVEDLVDPQFDKMNQILSRLSSDPKFREQVERRSLGSQKKQIITHLNKRAPPPPKQNNNNNNKNHQGRLDPCEARKNLPVFQHRQEIISKVKANDTVLLSGATGCGKSTGAPAALLESGMLPNDALIICTVPRRVAAISVAARVSEELNEPLGGAVGYTVRFDSQTSSATRLVYMTTGILLRRLHSDPTLQDVGAVFVDEVHERDMNTDFVLMLLKDLINVNKLHGTKRRYPLKLIVMSATMQTEKLVQYLSSTVAKLQNNNNAAHIPHISIQGTLHPVRTHYLEDVHRLLNMPPPSERDILTQFGAAVASLTHTHNKQHSHIKGHKEHQDASNMPSFDSFAENATMMSADRELESLVPYGLICNLIRHIHTREKNSDKGTQGAVLIFLPGWGAIDRMMKSLRDMQPNNIVRELSILPLHSSLSLSEQRLVFDPPPRNFRKIILATNIAETSITVEDVVFVIDTVLHKSTQYDAAGNTTQLTTSLVSQANCTQRRGRAGRVRSGDCYHLIPKRIFEQLPKYLAPEMLRSSLLDVCLQSKAIIGNNPVLSAAKKTSVATFLSTAMDPPPEMSVEHSVAHLKQLGAFNNKEILTGLGRALAHMPIDCILGKMLLLGACNGVLDAVSIITASLGAKSPFIRPPPHLQKEAQQARIRLAGTSASDHLAILYLYRRWKAAARPAFVAQEFFADNFVLFNIDRTVKQLKQAVLDSGFVRLQSSNSNNNNNSSEDQSQQHRRRRRGGNSGKLDEDIEELDRIASRFGDNASLIQLCLSMALYPNFASKENPIKKRRNHQWICWDEKHAQISPGSVVSACSASDLYGREFLVFFDRMRIETQIMLFDATALPRSLMALGCRYLDRLDEQETRNEIKECSENEGQDCLYLPLEKTFMNNNNNDNNDEEGDQPSSPTSTAVTLPSGYSALVVDEGMKRFGAPKRVTDVLWKLHCTLHFFFSFACQQMHVTEFPAKELTAAIGFIGGTPATESANRKTNNDDDAIQRPANNNNNPEKMLIRATDMKKKPANDDDSDDEEEEESDDEDLPMVVAGLSAPTLQPISAAEVESLSAMLGDLSVFGKANNNSTAPASPPKPRNNNDDDEDEVVVVESWA